MVQNSKPRKRPKSFKKTKRGLTPKQKLFVREYLVDMNATRAYLRAGYKVSEKVAGAAGLRMLKNDVVSKAINKSLGHRLNKIEINNDTVLQEIAKLAFCNIRDYIKIREDGKADMDLSSLTREQAAAIQELTFDDGKVKFKLADKKGSLDMLAKYLKLFSDTLPVTSTRTAKLLKAVLDGTMTAREAAYKFNMLGLPLPEVLRIELSKAPPEPPPPDIPPAMEDAELEERYRRALERNEQQTGEWVPKRQEEVKEIKNDLKGIDSFAPGMEGETRSDE